MRRLLFGLFLVAFFLCIAHLGFAQEASEAADKTAPAASSLAADIKKAKELLMGEGGDNIFARGFLVALFQPVF